MIRDWSKWGVEDMEEILACMEDSDRYINEGRKKVIIRTLKRELVERGLTQYDESPENKRYV